MNFLLPSDSFMCEACGRCSLSWGLSDTGGVACPDCGLAVEPIQVLIVHADGHEDPVPNEDTRPT